MNQMWQKFILGALIALIVTGCRGSDKPPPNSGIPTPSVPWIVISPIPKYETNEKACGRVGNIDRSQYMIVVYIHVPDLGWWVKPYFAWPTTNISADYTWCTDIATGGRDIYSTKIAAFVIPKSYSPPLLGGADELPRSLMDAAIVWTLVERGPQTALSPTPTKTAVIVATRTPTPIRTATPTKTATPALTPTATPAEPQIAITTIPSYCTHEDIEGIVGGVDPRLYRITLAIYVQGWWTKPYFSQPTVPIRNDSSWSGDITTGGCDACSTRIAAFLIPASYSPPLMQSAAEIPQELYNNSLAWVIVDRGPEQRVVRFADYDWIVKRFDCPAGPGPNLFSDKDEDVFVDNEGALHLSIAQHDNQWYSTEVILEENFGYGQYIFQTRGRIDELDPCAVLGQFLWDNFAPPNYRELDIEYSRWCNEKETNNTQFVVQPYTRSGNLYRFPVALTDNNNELTNVITWRPGRVDFVIYHGHHDMTSPPPEHDVIVSWTYEGPDVPTPGQENPRINLWQMSGQPPVYGQRVEVVTSNFFFLPVDSSIPTATVTPERPTPTASPTNPWITISPIPAYGTNDNACGFVGNVDESKNSIVIYIHVPGWGWWVKPYFAWPITTISPDHTWCADITTGGQDAYSTKIAAFVIPKTYSPPLLGKSSEIPKEVFDNSIAWTMVERGP